MPPALFESLNTLFTSVFNTPAAHSSVFAPTADAHCLVVTAPLAGAGSLRVCVGFAVLFDAAFVQAVPASKAYWQLRHSIHADDTYVGFMCVADDSRGQGLGSVFLSTLKQRATAAGKGGAIWLESDTCNEEAHAWYVRAKFEQVAVLEEYDAGQLGLLLRWAAAVVIE